VAEPTAQDDTLFGTSGNDNIQGLGGNDYIDGELGNDTMIGGLGDDLYVVESAGDVVVESLDEGYDGVTSNITYSLAANIEYLSLSGTNAINGNGNDSDNFLSGNDGVNLLSGGSGNDELDGGSGNDTLIGGIGNDTYDFYIGYGHDQIDNAATDNATAVDALYLWSLTPSDVVLSRTLNDLLITVNPSDSINIKNYFTGEDNKIDQIVFYDSLLGTEILWTQTDIQQHIVSVPTAGDDNLIGTSGNDVIDALAGNDNIFGVDGNDQLTGGLGNDYLDGGNGVDTLIGGAGNDTYVIDNVGDIVTEAASAGTDTVQSSITYTLSTNLENLTLIGTTNINGTGNAVANVITGNAGNNVLNGLAGSDTMIGGLGNDTYTIDALTDVITENLNEGTDQVNVAITTASGIYTVAANVENATLTNTVAYNITGNALDNVLTGNGLVNTLNGGIGADTMIGGSGNDIYIVDNVGDVVTETSTLTTEVDSVQSSITYTLGTNVENLTLTGTSVINGTGNALNNTLTGNTGNNTLDGGAGVDTLVGGAGNDTYIVDLTATNTLQDTVTEAASGGVDALILRGGVVAAVSTITLGTEVDNLDASATGTTLLNLTGNTLANVITGNAANNVINGLAGNDTMIGGLGNDTYTIDVLTDVITENLNEGTDLVNVAIATASGTYTVAANVENATLTNTVAYSLIGNALDNVLTGNALANTLTGAAGNDTLNGLAGNDTMIGGLGNDTYTIDVLTDVITESLNEGTDLVNVAIATASGTYTVAANVENATLINSVAYSLTGNALDNILIGNAAVNTINGGTGNDTLDGAAGVDVLVGGAGNDTYIVDLTSTNTLQDTVTEAASGGVDTIILRGGVVAAVSTITLGTEVDNLDASATGTTLLNLTGNALANFMKGNAANNTLTDTAGGNDMLQGFAGNDTFNDTVGNNLFDGGLGNDLITAGVGRDILIGGQGNDTITTGTGYDVIVFNKGDGQDIINASTGADNTISLGGNFAYSDLSLTKSTNDLILKMGASDQITLKDWYLTSPSNKSVINLQVVAEAIQGFTLGGADALRNNKIENFNFSNLVAAFDTAGATANWQLTDARLTTHLQAGSDTAAIGGDLAYQYGKNSNLTGMGLLNAQSVIAAASFGQTVQTLNNPTVWQAEVVKLG
jgi:Ca2+-binding RTX toxin-like protein